MKLGFMGIGNMGGAIAKGVINGGLIQASDIYVFDVDSERMHAFADSTGANACVNAMEMARAADICVLAVKPVYVMGAIEMLKDGLYGKAVISIVAGLTNKVLKKALPEDCRYLTVMPNTPAMVGEGATAMCSENTLTPEEMRFAKALFGSLGTAISVPERLMSAVAGVSGCGPAYVFMFAEAMADGGVMMGLPRADAQKLAAMTLIGAGHMLLESGMHPGALKDMVCSPGGSTIVGVRALEKANFRAAVMDAVVKSAKKSEDMREDLE